MNKRLWAFTLWLILLAAAIGLAGEFLGHPSFLLAIITVLTGATWLVYFFVQKAKPEDFVRNYAATIVVKLMAGGIFVSALIYADKSDADANAIFFMASYFLLTGLEVAFLFRQLA